MSGWSRSAIGIFSEIPKAYQDPTIGEHIRSGTKLGQESPFKMDTHEDRCTDGIPWAVYQEQLESPLDVVAAGDIDGEQTRTGTLVENDLSQNSERAEAITGTE